MKISLLGYDAVWSGRFIFPPIHSALENCLSRGPLLPYSISLDFPLPAISSLRAIIHTIHPALEKWSVFTYSHWFASVPGPGRPSSYSSTIFSMLCSILKRQAASSSKTVVMIRLCDVASQSWLWKPQISCLFEMVLGMVHVLMK
jgi:hypothetical protein